MLFSLIMILMGTHGCRVRHPKTYTLGNFLPLKLIVIIDMVGKISALPHTWLELYSFLEQCKYDSDVCIINVWGCAEIFPGIVLH